jgi:hypothetical protein
MYSDRDFNIREEYVEEIEITRRRNRGPHGQVEAQSLTQIILWVAASIVAAMLVLAFLGWATAPQPQPLTKETVCQSSESQKNPNLCGSRETKLSSPLPNPTNPQPRSEGSSPRPNGTDGEGAATSAAPIYADTQTLTDRSGNNAGELPSPGAVRVQREIRLPRAAPTAEGIRNRCGSVGVHIPPGRTASLFESSSGGTPLDTVRGPAVLVLREGQCVESDTEHVCLVCGSGSQVPERVRLDSFEELEKRHKQNSEELDRLFREAEEEIKK